MLLLVLLITLALIGLRLYGVVNIAYQAVAHTFVGLLIGYWTGTHEWLTGVCALALCVTEIYAAVTKFWPALAVGSLLNKLNPPVVKK